MSYFEYMGTQIAYKIDGESSKKPLVLLNGIMMSMASWETFIPNLTKYRKVIRIDMIDQGISGKMEKEYTVADQAKAVMFLLDYLKISKYDIFGISYGAHVALSIATMDISKVDKLVVFNCLANTNFLLRDIGISWKLAAKHNDPELFFYNTIPIIYSTKFYVENYKWLEARKPFLIDVFKEPFLNSMIRLIDSSESYDVRDRLKLIEADTLVVGASNDLLTPAELTKSIANQVKNAKYIEIPDCGHASMYEKPNEFISILIGFLEQESINLF